jgi:hypothetical protein
MRKADLVVACGGPVGTMRRMKFRMHHAVLALLLVSAVTAANASAEDAKAPAAPAAPAPAAPAPKAAAEAAGQMTPDKVVASYLKAMQEQRFSDAYQYTSSTLRAGKGVEEWAKEQQYVMQMGEVKIIDFKVYPAIIGADGIARVPNILKSQDKFLNQLGLDEHEIYMLIKESGGWKIDQQTLAEGPDRAEYFPDDSPKK